MKSLFAEAVDLVLRIRHRLPLWTRKIPGVWDSLDRLEVIFKKMERKLAERDADRKTRGSNGSWDEKS